MQSGQRKAIEDLKSQKIASEERSIVMKELIKKRKQKGIEFENKLVSKLKSKPRNTTSTERREWGSHNVEEDQKKIENLLKDKEKISKLNYKGSISNLPDEKLLMAK